MLWEYIKEVAGASLDFARGGGEMIEIIFWIAVFFVPKIPKFLSKREERGIEQEKSLRKIFIHKFLTNDGWRFAVVIIGCFVFHFLVIAPYLVYKKIAPENARMQAQLDDKSPKLDGFIDQWMLFVQPGETNTTIIPQIHINNFGGSGSLAENFKLKLILATNDSADAKPIDISNYYQWQGMKGDQITVFRLTRQELISEKAGTAIETGFGPRGWLAFTVPRILSQKQLANYHFVISFLNVVGNEIFVTNKVWRGKALTNSESFDIPRTLAGSVNLVYTNYQLQSDVANGWRPPELPPDCTNIIVWFGPARLVFPRILVEAPTNAGGRLFDFNDVPADMVSFYEKSPNFSYLQNKVPPGFSRIQALIDGKTLDWPFNPIVVSNRLFVEVVLPFSNEKRKIIMDGSFDSALSIPRYWDRNYSTNYNATSGIYAYEVVNELTNPVLQVFYTGRNEVHLNGIFKMDENKIFASFEQPPQFFGLMVSTNATGPKSLAITNFLDVVTIDTNNSIQEIETTITNAFYHPVFPGQRAIFKYHSRSHLGSIEDWVLRPNKSVTNIVDTPQ